MTLLLNLSSAFNSQPLSPVTNSHPLASQTWSFPESPHTSTNEHLASSTHTPPLFLTLALCRCPSDLCLTSLLFSIYDFGLGQLIGSCSFQSYFYNDDTQMYLSGPDDTPLLSRTPEHLTDTSSLFSSCFLNMKKTEFIILLSCNSNLRLHQNN